MLYLNEGYVLCLKVECCVEWISLFSHGMSGRWKIADYELKDFALDNVFHDVSVLLDY